MADMQAIVLGGIDIAALFLLAYLLRKSVILSSTRRKLFLTAIFLASFIILAETCTLLTEGVPGKAAHLLHIWANALGFALSVFLPVLLSFVLDEASHRPSYLMLFLPPALVAAISLISPFTGFLFEVSADNLYQRGPMFAAYIAASVYSLSLLLVATFTQSHRLERREGTYFFLLVGLVLIGTGMQVFFPELHTSWHCVTLSLILYYLFLRELSYKYDVVTGVLCRAAFDQQLELLPLQNSAVLIFDINDFKQVNDRYGHEIGDRCLAVTGRLLQHSFRPLGRCFRVGGDEFAVLALTYSEPLFQSCVESMMAAIHAERTTLPMLPYISYGRAVCNGDPLTARQNADAEMYRYKYRTKAAR